MELILNTGSMIYLLARQNIHQVPDYSKKFILIIFNILF